MPVAGNAAVSSAALRPLAARWVRSLWCGRCRCSRARSRIGRAHIASVINTTVLAYAGASLPLMLLFATGNTPAGELLTGELITQETR